MNRAVFLDRDGVINRAIVRGGRPRAPLSMEELEFLPGVQEAIERLRQVGFRIIVVTNQPDVAKGVQRREMVEAIHAHIAGTFAIDEIKACYHADWDQCRCRKPKPGLLLEAANNWKLDLSQSIMIGDRWCDIEAGKSAGCKTIWIRSSYEERSVRGPDAIVESLVEASTVVLSKWVRSREARSSMDQTPPHRRTRATMKRGGVHT